MDTPTAGTTPNMVAVGNGKFPGTKSQSANAQAVLAQTPIPVWRPRNGRDSAYPFWEDGINDAIAALGMSRETINEAPPARPPGSTQTVEQFKLWAAAVNHYQHEGTVLFDLVRPTLDLSGPHAELDLRRLKNWKRDDRRDGRALVRWALSFVDRSSVEGQTAILNEIAAKKLPASGTLLDLQTHLFGLWDLWLELSNNTREAPAAFFSQLLMSMPLSPECPMVHVRRYLADLVRKNESALLRDVDGDHGLFADMIKYAETLGVEEAPMSSLHVQTEAPPVPGGGGGKSKAKNDCCLSFACTKESRGNDGCICLWGSKFDLSKLSNKRKRYVELLRKYNKAHPDKSLKVAIKVVREAVGDEGDKQLTFMTSVESVMGNNINNVDELDAWLNDHDGETFYTLGMVEGEGDLQFVVEEVPPGYDAEAESLAGSLNMMTGSAGSTHSATDAELECIKLKAALEETRNQLMALQAAPPPTRAPSPSLNLPAATPTTRGSNPALDAPPTLANIGALTPKQIWDSHLSTYFATPLDKVKSWTVRRPQFSLTGSTPTIAEEDTPAGGARKDDTPVEMVCKAIVKERRGMKEKLKQRSLTGYLLTRFLANILLFSAGCGEAMMEAIYRHCYEQKTSHTLLTMGLLIHATKDAVWKPLIKFIAMHSAKLMVKLSREQAKAVIEHVRAALTTLVSTTVAKLVTLAAARIGLTVTRPGSATTSTDADVQASPTPSATPVSTSTGVGGVPNPDSASPADDSGCSTLMPLYMMEEGKLGNSVLLASLELKATSVGKPALMDNGASNGTSCTRSLDGAVAGTFRASDAGCIGIGSEGVSLASKGSWLFVLERRGVNGSEVVVRRLKYTPKLPMEIVFSEANEVVVHGYSIIWKSGEKRKMVAPSGQAIELHMSKSELGWLKVVPITDVDKQKEVLTRIGNPEKGDVPMSNGWQLSVKTYDPAQVRSVNMGKSKPLKGVALVRRQHCVDGHPALPITVKNLKLQGAFDKKLVTLTHVKIFQEQGCGVCDLAKMRRRAFTIKMAPLDPTPPMLGKLWELDVLELRVPDINSGVTYVYAAVEKVSKMALVGGMAGYTEQDVLRVLNEVQARVRPTHGDIRVIRADSHPTHRAKGVKDYLLHNQLHLQLSPPYVHEGVGNVENFFLICVPSANALLLAAPDLGENHFLQALRYVAGSRNHNVTSNSNPPKSPAMMYYNIDQYRSAGLHVFGASAMALVHGEARDSKFDEHARACVYVGPAVNSDSSAHAAVFFDKRYLDVDVGCMTVTENVVLERTQRDHPSTQPYNQVGGGKTVDVGKPTSLFDLSGYTYKEDELPHVQPIIYVRGMPMPTEYVVLLLWHGTLRPGDMSSWVYELGANRVVPIPIDLKVGGQEHNLARKPVKDAMLMALGKHNVLGSFYQPECSPFSAARFKQPGPPVLFNSDYPDGVPDEHGEVPDEVMIALNTVNFVATLFRVTANTDKAAGLEFPASQGRGSPFAAEGREKHSTIADTTIMRAVTNELKLEAVHTEQGATGAPTRKPTTVLATQRFAHALARTIGTLVNTPNPNQAAIVGTNAQGQYTTSSSEVYTPEFAMRITIALLGSIPKVMAALKDETVSEAAKASTEDLYPVGTRVELYWYGERVWYAATVIDSAVRKGKVHGTMVERREIKVKYDADSVVMWHALSDVSVRVLHDDDEDRDPAEDDNATVLSLLDDRRNVTLPDISNELDFLASLNALDRAPVCEVDEKAVADARLAAHFDIAPPPPSDSQVRDAAAQYQLDSAEFQRAMHEESVRANGMLGAHAGEVFVARQVLIAIEDQTVVENGAVFAVLDDGSATPVDYSQAHKWHVPANEREFMKSPQKALWTTAKELKMDDYNKVRMFDLVPRSSVDETKHTIYKTLWAYKIKFDEGGLKFQKLNPRWCVRGGSMDRDLFKSYAEMMRATSLNIIWGIKAAFYDELTEAMIDLKDAFQSTSTVDENGKLLEGEHEFYTEQAPGFKKFGPNGEELVCKQNCYMQGRIDATAGFDRRLMQIMTKSAHCTPLLWDPKVLVFNTTKHAGTTATLRETIEEGNRVVKSGEDSGPQQVPIGFAIFGIHVDDMAALATGLRGFKDNRILTFVHGEIATVYACKFTVWHGRKALGFDMDLNDERRTVTITARGALQAIRDKLFTKDQFKAQPRHIVTEAVYERSPGEVPVEGDPERDSYLTRQALTRSVLGAGIWAAQAYPQIASGINSMCSDMANPSDARLGQLRHMFMHIGPDPPGKTFGGAHVTDIGSDADEIAPFTTSKKEGRYHFFSDASMNVTGGIGCFAGACIQNLCLRQHLQAPCAHTSELVAAGTNIHAIIPVNGLLQELGLRRGRATTTYFDSVSTVFVASSDAAPKKSVWLARRTKVVTEAVEHGEIKPVHINEKDMVADSCTKYIKHETWARHMHYILNLPGDPPGCTKEGAVVAAADAKVKNKNKNN